MNQREGEGRVASGRVRAGSRHRLDVGIHVTPKRAMQSIRADNRRAAMRILDRVKRDGRRVSSFVSWCGGLPEPSASNVRAICPPNQTLA
jgi:hypothetical protein